MKLILQVVISKLGPILLSLCSKSVHRESSIFTEYSPIMTCPEQGCQGPCGYKDSRNDSRLENISWHSSKSDTITDSQEGMLTLLHCCVPPIISQDTLGCNPPSNSATHMLIDADWSQLSNDGGSVPFTLQQP